MAEAQIDLPGALETRLERGEVLYLPACPFPLPAGNDLLHIDAFPSRPTGGARILRLFANINPVEPRVWMTSNTFPRLLERYGHEAGLPTGDRAGWARQLGRAVLGLFAGQPRRTAYD